MAAGFERPKHTARSETRQVLEQRSELGDDAAVVPRVCDEQQEAIRWIVTPLRVVAPAHGLDVPNPHLELDCGPLTAPEQHPVLGSQPVGFGQIGNQFELIPTAPTQTRAVPAESTSFLAGDSTNRQSSGASDAGADESAVAATKRRATAQAWRAAATAGWSGRRAAAAA